MFALGIRYLNGFSAAAEFDNRERAEWPPHPGRIFMAMAAAHFQSGADPLERQALQWLEDVDQAPAMKVPEAIQRAVVTHYVPVNDKAGPSSAMLQSAPLTRDRQPRTFARAWLDSDTAFLVWPSVEPQEPILTALKSLCTKVTRIGHSSSLVQMWVARPEEVGEPNWVPDEDRAVIRLRVATPGTLEDLERRYNGQAVETYAALKVAAEDKSDKKAQRAAKKKLQEEFTNGPPRRDRPSLIITQGYAKPKQLEEAVAAPETVFDPHLLVLRLEPKNAPYRYLDLPCVLTLTQRWREALLSHSNDLSDTARRILSGHDSNGGVLEGPHLAFLPLAFVAHEHADGHLLGVGLTLPKDLSRDDRREVLKAVGRVGDLKLGRMGVWRVSPETRESVLVTLRPETWTAHPKGYTHWATITPIVYDRHPKSHDKATCVTEVASMIRQACIRIKLPEPQEVIVTPVSPHLGVPPAHLFPRVRRKDNSLRCHTHAILVFDRPVRGPILLGAGRYRGYGCCRPLLEAL
ncbi:MAG: type I-U CRISPR-associated protein Csb2 [Anaerolineales bacterium]|nr:type I-U CRISPR-associated protein Csb2 [Anaerolineales bacterium]MDW8447025.1 type I-U CRISPR-associated protein Csb2 [Anaerolineales bacterium]